jgi:hypothetical protein
MTRALAIPALGLGLALLLYWPLVVWAVACPVMHAAACTVAP